jgi:hypothetical protein
MPRPSAQPVGFSWRVRSRVNRPVLPRRWQDFFCWMLEEWLRTQGLRPFRWNHAELPRANFGGAPVAGAQQRPSRARDANVALNLDRARWPGRRCLRSRQPLLRQQNPAGHCVRLRRAEAFAHFAGQIRLHVLRQTA